MTVVARIEKDGVLLGRILADFSVEWLPGGREKSNGVDKAIDYVIDADSGDFLACSVIFVQIAELADLTKNGPAQVVPVPQEDYGASEDAL
jgi:hypothetical protein